MTYFVYNLFGSLCCYISCICLLPQKLSIVKKMSTFTVMFLCAYIFNRSHGQAATFLIIASGILLIGFFTQFDLFSMCCSLWGYFYCVTCNYLFLWAANALFGITIQTLSSDLYLTGMFSLLFCLFCYITLKFIFHLIYHRYSIQQWLDKPGVVRPFFILLLLLALLLMFYIVYGEHMGYGPEFVALNAALFLVFFTSLMVLLCYFHQRFQEELELENRLALFESNQIYTRSLENSYALLRRYKHDSMNILTTMSGFLTDGDFEALKEYYENKIVPLCHSMTKSDLRLESLSNIKSPELKGLLFSKLSFGTELGIRIDVEILEPIKELYMDTLDLARILGIFLDNAMEASTNTEEKNIKFCMLYQQKNLFILIQNSTLPPVHPIETLNKCGVSEKGADRGLGLYSAAEILKGYPHVIWETSYSDGYFTQSLTLLAH